METTPVLTFGNVRDAMARAAEFLLACQFPSGAINDPIADPFAALASARRSRRLRFRLKGGADIWHTTNAALALACTGRHNLAAERFVCTRLSRAGELSYWSSYPSLCIETCSAAAQAFPRLRSRLREIIVRHALPGGRWATSMLPAHGGYDAYLAGPSVTAWALGALGGARADLGRAGRRYLRSTLASDGLWQAHPAFYATPFYPAHVAVRFLPPLERAAIVKATLRLQRVGGGWGFGERGDASALPTALAISTLLASGVKSAAAVRATKGGVGWLLTNQTAAGRFRLAPAPSVVFYAGDVYATCVATMALAAATEVVV